MVPDLPAQLVEAALSIETPDNVDLPTNEDQAALMVLLGTDWLKRHAPHRLKKQVAAGAGERSVDVEAFARQVLLDFRRRDGLTCYVYAENEVKDIRNMKAALEASFGPLLSALKAAGEEREYWKGLAFVAGGQRDDAEAKAASLQQENDRLREALAFYGDERNYGEVPHPQITNGIMLPIKTDKGKRARAALSPQGEK